jgi:dipeptide/tripeptide permease
MLWFVLSYVFFGIGDIFIWPVQLAIVTALAPRSMTSFAVGSWYVTVGLGTYIAGAIGAWGERVGTLTALVRVLLLVLAALIVIHLLRPWFAARSRSGEEVSVVSAAAKPVSS